MKTTREPVEFTDIRWTQLKGYERLDKNKASFDESSKALMVIVSGYEDLFP